MKKQYTLTEDKNFCGVYVFKTMWESLIQNTDELENLYDACKNFDNNEEFFKTFVISVNRGQARGERKVVLASIEYEHDSALSTAYPIVVNAKIRKGNVKEVQLISESTQYKEEKVTSAIQEYLDNTSKKENVL